MLEDLMVSAVNQAIEKLMELQAEEMRSMTGGINLPGLNEALSGMGFPK
jgi:DNA-binding protein YbaB